MNDDERQYWEQKQRYAGFDPATAERLRKADAEKLRRDADMLEAQAREVRREASRHRGTLTDDYSDQRALRASGEQNWLYATRERAVSEAQGELYGVQPRLTASSYFTQRGLISTRTLVAADSTSVSASVQQPTGVPGASNSFLPLCDVRRPDTRFGNASIGRWDALPAATVQADETTEISPSAPASSVSTRAPINIGVVLEESKQWAIESPHGATSTIELAANSVRTKTQQQIIEGTGSNGEALGLAVDTNLPHAAGTTLAASHIVAALESVEAGAGDAPLAWVVTAAAAEIARARAWITGGAPIMADNRISGYPVIVIGGCTGAHMIFGRWRDLLVIERQPLEVSVNPFQVFRADIIGLKAWIRFDAAPRVNSSFYAITSVT